MENEGRVQRTTVGVNSKRMKQVGWGVGLVVLLATSGCHATLSRNTAIWGLAMGAGLGALAGIPSGGILQGALVGAGTGMAAGSLVGQQAELDRQAQEEEKFLDHVERDFSKDEAKAAGAPPSEGARWVDTSYRQRVWVEDRWDGQEWVDAHYEERMIAAGHWQSDGSQAARVQ